MEIKSRISGYVYLISGETAKIKIGMSADPQSRLPLLQTGNHTNLEILATFGHTYPGAVEQEAHRLLSAHWLVGEWFEVDKYHAMATVMDAMRNVDARPPRKVPITPVTVDDEEDREKPIKIDLSGAYEVPPVKQEDKAEWLIGYVRPIDGVPAGKQMQWLRSAGVPDKNTYIEVMPISRPEMKGALMDCRSGDALLAWSPEVFGDADTVRKTEIEVNEKGARIVYA